MDISRIIQTVARVTGLDRNRLSEAAQKAGAYKHVRTKEEALQTLRKVGVDDNALDRVQSLLDNPLAGSIASMAGLNTADISHAIDDLRNGGSQPSSSGSADSRIMRLRAGLNKTKHR